MDKREYENWQKLTERSKTQWVLDEVMRLNGTVLFYKGGSDGVFIMIEKDGTASIGEYKWAIPHIGEAVFETKHSKKFESQDAASKVVLEKLGVGFLLNWLFGGQS